MSTLKLLLAGAASATLFATTMSQPASAETPTPSCSSDQTSTSQVVGDDACTVNANSLVVLASATATGPDVQDVNILGNDGLAGASCWDITDDEIVPNEDVSVDLYKNLPGDGQDYCSFALFLSTAAHGTYTFDYTLKDGGTRTVTLNVKPYVPPTPPTVKKVKKPGYIKVCNRYTRGMDFYYRGIRQSQLDGTKWVAALSCKLVRVHRHGIAWVAIVHSTGEFMGSGTVRHIVLPAGDGPSNILSPNATLRSLTSALRMFIRQ